MSTNYLIRALLLATLAIPATAFAEGDAFIQGLVGYSSPVAGERYMDGLKNDGDGGPRVGIRAGWTPVVLGRVHLGFDAGIDWRPLTLDSGEGSAQQVRVLGGPRVAFVADHYTVFFRLAAGYDHLYLNDIDAEGYAIEPGFGANVRYQQLIFGAELEIPVTIHNEEDAGKIYGADMQVLLSVGAEL